MIWEPDSGEPSRDHGAAEGDAAGSGLLGHLQSVAEPVATAVEPIVSHVVVPVADALGSVIEAANSAISGSTATERRLRRLNRKPLANLYELHPEARQASPRELGMRFVPLEEIAGTAVAGADQRGADFLPLRPFRGENWQARWNRIRAANERLQPLPPVDLVKYDGSYWVLDGHNRMAAALYAGGAGLDAMVTELVPLDGQTSERPTQLAGLLSEAGELRAAAAGDRPAFAMRHGDHHVPEELERLPEPEADDRPDGAGAPDETERHGRPETAQPAGHSVEGAER
jgi:hypothetical protein